MPLKFGSSGVRGKYADDITPQAAFELGSILRHILGQRIALGRDPRASGQTLRAAFLAAALQSGDEITDYDLIPTPALAYQTGTTGLDGGVMITASHNPPEYNGFKIFNSKGESLEDSSIFSEASSGDFDRAQSYKAGRVEVAAPIQYVKRLNSIVLRKKWRIVIDPGNGATSRLAPEIYRRSVGRTTALNSNPDPHFSGRGSEPTIASVATLSKVVSESKADAGIAFDGDGDRFYIVDQKGVCPLQDRILASFVSFLARESKGPYLIPVDASMAVDEAVAEYGAKIVRGPVGDAKLLAEMKRAGASFAGEPSGAWIHASFHPCPDGLLSGILYLQQLEKFDLTVSQAVEPIPEYHMVRRSVRIEKKTPSPGNDYLSQPLAAIIGNDSQIDTKFGIRVSSTDSWVLVRESGTEPVIRITVESKRPSLAERICNDTVLLVRRLYKAAA